MEEIIPPLVKTVQASCFVGDTLELRKLGHYFINNCQYNQRKQNTQLLAVWNVEPSAKLQVYSSGNVIILGASSPHHALLAARRVFHRIKRQNPVGYCFWKRILAIVYLGFRLFLTRTVFSRSC